MLPDKHPSLSDNVKLGLAVKALNDTTGPKRLVTSLLVFGVIPSLRNSKANLTYQEECFTVMHNARAEAAKITAEQHITLTTTYQFHTIREVQTKIRAIGYGIQRTIKEMD